MNSKKLLLQKKLRGIELTKRNIENIGITTDATGQLNESATVITVVTIDRMIATTKKTRMDIDISDRDTIEIALIKMTSAVADAIGIETAM